MDRGLGQYDQEYADCHCFWGTDPGKYVRLIPRYAAAGSVLDLGAGEGKNAIYLAELGFDVVAVECSVFAIRNFRRRMAELKKSVAERIEIVEADVTTYDPVESFDVVVAYGLLHCLPSVPVISGVVAMMQECTKSRGVNVIATFTDALPVPDAQRYLQPTLLQPGMLERSYHSWHIRAAENDVIEETHPTSKVPHMHSLCRLLAMKDIDEARIRYGDR